jgi:hypothetical protein
VCTGDAYIDKFIVSRGTATIDANSTRAFRATGILSVQGRCSDGKQLGYYGPSPSDTSVSFLQENIAVTSHLSKHAGSMRRAKLQGSLHRNTESAGGCTVATYMCLSMHGITTPCMLARAPPAPSGDFQAGIASRGRSAQLLTCCEIPLQVVSPDGFSSLNGTGMGFVEGLLDVGEMTMQEGDTWLTPCPAGSRVDGYQVTKGGLIYQIRPRCSCENCGKQRRCTPAWQYTTA